MANQNIHADNILRKIPITILNQNCYLLARSLPGKNLASEPAFSTEFLTGSTVLFLLLVTLGIRNIWIHENMSEVLSATKEVQPETVPEPEPKTEKI